MISPAWYNQKARIERYRSTTASQTETGSWSTVHDEAACSLAGVYSKPDATMLGHIAVDEWIATFPDWAITDDYGYEDWPEEHDRVTVAGKVYYVSSVSDQTMSASHFTIPRHKVVRLTLKPTRKAVG